MPKTLVTDKIELEKIRSGVLEQLSVLLQIQTYLHHFREVILELMYDFLLDASVSNIDSLLERNTRLIQTLRLLHQEEKVLVKKGNLTAQYTIKNFNDVVDSLKKCHSATGVLFNAGSID